jgi:hypothetical protein
MTRKTYGINHFQRWLEKLPAEEWFGNSADDCPIAKWTGLFASTRTIDKMPAWVNRFVGRWDGTIGVFKDKRPVRDAVRILDAIRV